MSTRAKVEEMVEEVLRPLLEKDGGSIDLVSFEGSVLTLRISGALLGCPGTPSVKAKVIEPALRSVAGRDVAFVYRRGHP